MASVAGMGWPHNIEKVQALIDVSSVDGAAAFCEEHGINADNCYQFSKEVLIVWTMKNWNTWRNRGIRINSVGNKLSAG